MAFSDYLEAVLRGGLPEVVDGGNPYGQGDTRPETTAPRGTLQDRESFAQSAGVAISEYGPYIAIGGVVLLGVIVLLMRRR